MICRAPASKGATMGGASVLAQQADEPALNLDALGREDAGLIGWVGGFQGNGVAAAAQALERCLLVVDEGDNDLAGLRAVLLADQHGVAVKDAGLDHRVPAHLE